MVGTYTNNVKISQNLLRSRFIPEIIQGAICPINQLVTKYVTVIQEILGSRQTVLPKASVMDAARSGARILQTPGTVIRTVREGSTPWVVNSAVSTARLNPPIPSSNSTSISPAQTGTQEITSPRRSIIAKRARNADPLGAHINEFLAVNGHSTSIFRKIIGLKTVPG